jgi:hypothetical protein
MHVDAAMRPHEEEYLRFIHLVDLFRETEWEPARMMAASPFRVIDVGTTRSCCGRNETCWRLPAVSGQVPKP